LTEHYHLPDAPLPLKPPELLPLLELDQLEPDELDDWDPPKKNPSSLWSLYEGLLGAWS
jgi:hypothetical protein